MLFNMSMGIKDASLHSASSIQNNGSPSVEIPLPPPPPPPNLNFSGSSVSPFPRFDTKRRSRLRNFNWETIPFEKVRGRPSLWSSETFQGELQIDTRRMEELFGKQEEDPQLRSPRTRRSMSVGDSQMSKVFLLDSRRSMNIGIFLKQFKRSAAEIVEDIRKGNGDAYSSERLSELLKHLPEREEVNRLKSFQGDRERLSEPDLFVLLLLELPSSTLRLEALIFKKDFHTIVLSLLSTARELKGAAEELLQCTELHYILRVVLKAGNFMNAGGYAGNAAGFRVSSLLKLAETKANKPGMSLLHFVVMEIQKKDERFIFFADKLKHVSISSRLSEDGLLQEYCKLQTRITTMCQNLRNPEQHEIREQMDEFLEYAKDKLREVQKEIEALQNSRQLLIEFLCEEEETFHLEECCKIFSCFCQRFQLAIKENKIRELEEQRRQQWEKKRLEKRHSMATCSSLDGFQEDDELELTLERNLRNARRTGSFRLCRMRSLGSSWPSTTMAHKSQSEKIQDYCEQQNAHQMREVSERVLRQQMRYKAYKDFCKSSVSGRSVSARNSGITDQFPVQNGPPGNQVPKQNESEISRQLHVLKVTDNRSLLLNQCGPVAIVHEKDQCEPDAFIHSPSQSVDEAPRQTHTLGKSTVCQYSQDKSMETASSTLTKQDGPLILSESLEMTTLETSRQPPNISNAATSHEILDRYICEESLCQILTNNSPHLVSWTATDNIQKLQTHSESVSPKQLVSPSASETQRQCITHCLSEKDTHSGVQQGSKLPFQSLVSEQPGWQLSQTDAETQRHSINQDKQELPTCTQEATQPPHNSHFHSQSEFLISTKSKGQFGQEIRKHLLFQSRLKIYRPSSTRSGSQTPNSSIIKPGQKIHVKSSSQLSEEVSKVTLVKSGTENVSHLRNTSGSESTDCPTSLSWSKSPEHSSTCSADYNQAVSKQDIGIPDVAQSGDDTVEAQIIQPLSIARVHPLTLSVSENAKHVLCHFKDGAALSTSISSVFPGSLSEVSNSAISQSLTQDKEKICIQSSDQPGLECQGGFVQQPGHVSFIHSLPETINSVTLPSLTQDKDETCIQSSDQPGLDTVTQSLAQTEPETLLHSVFLTKNNAAFQSMKQDKQETHRSLEQFRSDTLKKSLTQTAQKPSKQTLCQSVVKLSKQSIPKPMPKTPRQSTDQVGCGTSNISTSETSKHSPAKPGCSITRIKTNEPVTVRHLIRAKEINVQMLTTQDKLSESSNVSAKALKIEEVGCKASTKGLKYTQTPVQRSSPNPCSKWKKELQSASEKEYPRVESHSQEADWDNSRQSNGDNLKNSSPGRTGNNIGKKSRKSDFGFGAKRIHPNTDVTTACIQHVTKQRLSTSKQTQKEIKKSKLPQRLSSHSAVTIKPCPGKDMGNTRGKKEIPYPKVIEYSKVSERKSSPSLNAKCYVTPTQKSVNCTWNGTEPSRESSWTSQVTPKKTNSMARVAIHVIKSCDLNSSLPRGPQNSNLDPQKNWR